MRYGDALPPGFNVPRSAFWLRRDLTADGNPFKLVVLPVSAVVMDCGAYIGTFTAACLEQGASLVTCYEAAPKNAVLLRENVARYTHRVTVVEAALVATDETDVSLTLSGFSGANSILPSLNRPRSVRVSATNFRAELLRLRPHVVKLDVEGAEYDLLASLRSGDLASVETVFVEFHPIADRDERVYAAAQFIRSEGLTVASPRRRAFVASRTEAR